MSAVPGPRCKEAIRGSKRRDPNRPPRRQRQRAPYHTHRICQHAPEVAEERRAARSKGGYAATRSRVLAGDTPPLSLDSPAAVRQALEDTIQSIRTGQLAPNVGHAVLHGINVSLKLAELELSARLADLERQIAAQRRRI